MSDDSIEARIVRLRAELAEAEALKAYADVESAAGEWLCWAAGGEGPPPTAEEYTEAARVLEDAWASFQVWLHDRKVGKPTPLALTAVPMADPVGRGTDHGAIGEGHELPPPSAVPSPAGTPDVPRGTSLEHWDQLEVSMATGVAGALGLEPAAPLPMTTVAHTDGRTGRVYRDALGWRWEIRDRDGHAYNSEPLEDRMAADAALNKRLMGTVARQDRAAKLRGRVDRLGSGWKFSVGVLRGRAFPMRDTKEEAQADQVQWNNDNPPAGRRAQQGPPPRVSPALWDRVAMPDEVCSPPVGIEPAEPTWSEPNEDGMRTCLTCDGEGCKACDDEGFRWEESASEPEEAEPPTEMQPVREALAVAVGASPNARWIHPGSGWGPADDAGLVRHEICRGTGKLRRMEGLGKSRSEDMCKPCKGEGYKRCQERPRTAAR